MKKIAEPKYEVELLLGSKKTGVHLPKNTGNWFSYRILENDDEIGTVEIGRGSIFWKPYRNKRSDNHFAGHGATLLHVWKKKART